MGGSKGTGGAAPTWGEEAVEVPDDGPEGGPV